MKKHFLIVLFSFPIILMAQNTPLKTDTSQHKTRGVENPFISSTTKTYVSEDNLHLQKRASMMDLGKTQPRSTHPQLSIMDVNIITSGMDTIKMTGVKTSIFNTKK